MNSVLSNSEPPPETVPRPAGSRCDPPFGPVADDIATADQIFTDTLAQYRSPVAPLITHLRHYRGKRLRPALLLLTARACGTVTPAHHILAAVVEMIHTATLVHDDVLDEADTRRHIPTFNAEWGNKVAILLGDMLFTHAFHLTSRVDQRACELVGEATNRVCAGELQQIRERGNLHLTETEYFAIIDGKTAALTEVCGRLGALYAGAPEETADQLATYGRHLGIAFQIADDLLDLTGDTHTAGKTLGTDLEQQKLTLPLIHALHRLSPCDAEGLRDWLRSPDPARRERIGDLLRETGSVSYARRRAEELSRSARAALGGLPLSECRAILDQLTIWSIRREK
ncbi:MAG: polyprenyl synthetase family protein [Bacteroidales bacterium]|nr:polyprenyl synthetase family protein [Bacteroidales bacterium]